MRRDEEHSRKEVQLRRKSTGVTENLKEAGSGSTHLECQHSGSLGRSL